MTTFRLFVLFCCSMIIIANTSVTQCYFTAKIIVKLNLDFRGSEDGVTMTWPVDCVMAKNISSRV